MSSIADRLRELVGDQSVNGLAKQWGLSGTGLRAYIEGSIPSADKAARIAEKAGVSLVWLVTGVGPKERNQEVSHPEISGVHGTFHIGDDFAMVPRLVVQASAGPGSLVEHEDAIDMIAFQASWLRRRGINPQSARALTVRGDSMEPTIRSGDVLLVDTSRDHIEDNGIYVVVAGGLVLVKRVHPRLDGSIRLISDNQSYPPEDVRPGTDIDFHVAGRVMWFGRAI